ncbi:MAG: DnaJ domain-containing protein [Cyanobacteria bacterium P01_F01_bin.3]
MNLAHHFRTLGLRRSASFREVKRAYRQLVRQCHPDINPGEAAIERFIQINASYTALCEAFQLHESSHTSPANTANKHDKKQQPERLNLKELKRTLEKLGIGNFQQDDEQNPSQAARARASADSIAKPQATPRANTPPSNSTQTDPNPQPSVSSSASTEDMGIKQDAYNQLKDLLRHQKFPRAIALVEGLAHRLPEDSEINQWQAIVYQRWGRALISQGQFHKAHLYLRKALQTDPNNPSLSNEVARDLGLLKHIQAAEAKLS